MKKFVLVPLLLLTIFTFTFMTFAHEYKSPNENYYNTDMPKDYIEHNYTPKSLEAYSIFDEDSEYIETESLYITPASLAHIQVSTPLELSQAIAAASASGGTPHTIELTADILWDSGALFLTNGANVTLTGGYTITQNHFSRHFFLTGDSTLTLMDITLVGAEILHSAGRGGVSLNPGTLTMEDGSTIMNVSFWGGGSNAAGVGATNGSTFIMNGGTISDNHSGATGGGVTISESTFIMNGGTIAGNSSGSGGGVHIERGTFTMHGGEITGNTATAHFGGGVYLDNSTFTMNYGKINGNTAEGTGTGGGVQLRNNSTFTMNGGEINGNTAIDGGGVNINSSTFNINSGEINGNTGAYGGGVSVSLDSTLIINSGTISNNTATGIEALSIPAIGGGVIVIENGNFTMYDGLVHNNHALTTYPDSSGGGVFITFGGAFTMAGGTISNNTAENGGGISVLQDFFGMQATAQFNMQNGTISGNSATNNGGGIFTDAYDNLTIATTAIFNNNTANAPFDHGETNRGLPGNVPATSSGGGQGGNPQNINWSTVSIPNTHALNNFDINYSGTPIELFTVQYIANGGTGGPFVIANIINGTEMTVLGQSATGIIRPGYTFLGWNSVANGSGTSHPVGSTMTAAGNITLFAQWEAVTGNNPGPPSDGGNNNNPEGNRNPALTPTPRQPTADRHLHPARPAPLPIPAYPPNEQERWTHDWYIQGFPEGDVRPDGYVTRAEMAAIFFNLSKSPDKMIAYHNANFTDINPEDWYFKAINYTAMRHNAISGFPDGSFRPNQYITNAEFATLSTKFFKLHQIAPRSDFADQFDHWAANFIAYSFDDLWFDYFGHNYNFVPDAPIPRAVAITLLNHYLGRVPNPHSIHGFLQGRLIYRDLTPQSHWAFYEIMEASITHSFTRDAYNRKIWDVRNNWWLTKDVNLLGNWWFLIR